MEHAPIERPVEEPVDAASMPHEEANMQRREQNAIQEKAYRPETMASNYDPGNELDPAIKQQRLDEMQQLNQTYAPKEGYTYKNDQTFIEQMKAEKGKAPETGQNYDPRAHAEPIGRTIVARDMADTPAPDPELRAAVGPEGTGKDEA